MPTSIPIRVTTRQILDAGANYRIDQLGMRIAIGCLVTWAVCMLLVGAVARFGADAAMLDTFDLIASF